jgi:2-iminobutanoate/2-iminopropanoate deaminase
MPRKSFPKLESSPSTFYSHAVQAGDFIYVSGQGPWDFDTDEIMGETIEDQVTSTLNNVASVLAGCGRSMDDVVNVHVHLSDLRDFDRFNRVYARYFADPKPARTTVGSTLAGVLVEIDVIAYCRPEK